MKLFTDNYYYDNSKLFDLRQIHSNESACTYHFHSQFEFLQCSFGLAKINTIHGNIHLNPGECILLPPYTLHAVEFDNFKGLSFALKKTYLNKMFKSEFVKNLLTPLFNHILLLTNHTDTVEITDFFYKNTCASKCDHSFLYIADLLMLFKKNGKVATPSGIFKSQILQKMLAYIDSNIDSDLSVLTLAKQFHVTEYYICRLFKSKLNMTPVTYITNIRVLMACNMLINTHTDIKKISKLCGFKSHTYFHNIFKDNFGITPAKYRLNRR